MDLHNKYTENNRKNDKPGSGGHALLRRIILIAAGLIIGLNVYLANANGLLGNDLPMPFGYGLANVLSGSMEPTFSKGALLIVKQTDDPQVGDIVVYQDPGELVVHRIIEIDGDTVVTRGDANNAADPPFDKSEIKGVVIAHIPVLGSVAEALKTPAASVAVIICAILLVEFSFRKQRDSDDAEIEAIKEEIRRLKEEKEEQEAAPTGKENRNGHEEK